MRNVTDFTCEFGLSPDQHGACVITLASLCHSGYRTMQLAYIIAGLVALLVSAGKYLSAVRHEGNNKGV